MDGHENFRLEMEEPLSVRVEEPVSTRKNNIYLWFRHVFTLNEVLNEQHHRPLFIIVMCILHIFIHLLTYINITWRGEQFSFTLFNLFKFFVPCMRPAPDNIRTRIVSCHPSMENLTCYYDDELKKMCFSFMYPHQLWRMVTVNLLHMSWFHLLSNLSKQLLYGILLERKYGSVHVAAIYWLSNLGASLSFMLIDREESGVGVSGALYGLMLFFTVDRLIAMKRNTSRRLIILIQLALFILLPVVVTTILIIISKLEVAHSAHFGGGLVGFLYGISMFGCPLPWNNEHCLCQTISQRIAFVFLSLYYVVTLTILFRIDAPIVFAILDKF